MKIFAIFTFLVSLAAPAESACRQALVLGFDVSGSVDREEYRLQLDGMAEALEDSRVREAFFQFPETPVRFMVFEWSGMSHQRTIIQWQEITGPDQLDRISEDLRITESAPAGDDSTAVVAAMRYAEAELNRQNCWRRTFDISADGPANMGEHPGYIEEDQFPQMTVNALVIGPKNRANTTKNLSNVKSLESYFDSYVIRGPDAFVETASDYADFASAMKRKLIRELDVPVLSQSGTLPIFQ